MIAGIVAWLTPKIGKAGALIIGFIVCALLLIVLIGGPYWLGWSHRGDRDDAKQAEADARAASQLAAVETATAHRITAVEKVHEEDLANVQADADAAISDLQSGNLRLRTRLAAAPVSCPPGSAGGSHGAAPADVQPANAGPAISAAASASGDGFTPGLTAEDGTTLLRLAESADAVVLQLTACQSVIRAYQNAGR